MTRVDQKIVESVKTLLKTDGRLHVLTKIKNSVTMHSTVKVHRVHVFMWLPLQNYVSKRRRLIKLLVFRNFLLNMLQILTVMRPTVNED